MRILVTGANGFIGTALCARLEKDGCTVRKSVRALSAAAVDGEDVIASGDISAETDWSKALVGVNVVIHLAARAHILQETVSDPLREFREINTASTEHLARQAAEAGIKRFVYVSTIGVLGENTLPGRPFTEHSTPNPLRDYALSKWEAEQRLDEVRRATDLETVMVRPPLVYGPGAPGNFRRLLRLANTGVPLPFASVNNRRSMVGLENLVSFLSLCSRLPQAADQVFVISDGEALSTRSLITMIAAALGKKTLMLPVPPGLMRFGATLIGKRDLVNRLIDSLEIESSKARTLLDWHPPRTVEEGILAAVEGYKSSG